MANTCESGIQGNLSCGVCGTLAGGSDPCLPERICGVLRWLDALDTLPNECLTALLNSESVCPECRETLRGVLSRTDLAGWLLQRALRLERDSLAIGSDWRKSGIACA